MKLKNRGRKRSGGKGEMQMKVLQKRVGEPLKVVETAERYFMPCAKSFFEDGVWTERVYIQGYEFIMVVDEEGLRKRLPVNFFMGFKNPLFPVQIIVGDVVFIRNKKIDYEGEIDDWEVADITEDDIAAINNLLDSKRQITLSRLYKRMGGA